VPKPAATTINDTTSAATMAAIASLIRARRDSICPANDTMIVIVTNDT